MREEAERLPLPVSGKPAQHAMWIGGGGGTGPRGREGVAADCCLWTMPALLVSCLTGGTGLAMHDGDLLADNSADDPLPHIHVSRPGPSHHLSR